jgi:hypothetical protein
MYAICHCPASGTYIVDARGQGRGWSPSFRTRAAAEAWAQGKRGRWPGTWAMAEGKRHVFIPDRRVRPSAHHTYLALHGNGYTLAVQRRGHTVGYVTCDDLGFPTVRAWMEARC